MLVLKKGIANYSGRSRIWYTRINPELNREKLKLSGALSIIMHEFMMIGTHRP